MSLNQTIRYEYELRPELPEGFPPIDKVFPSLDEARGYRELHANTDYRSMNMPQPWRDAFEALGRAPIVYRRVVIGGWVQVEES